MYWRSEETNFLAEFFDTGPRLTMTSICDDYGLDNQQTPGDPTG